MFEQKSVCCGRPCVAAEIVACDSGHKRNVQLLGVLFNAMKKGRGEDAEWKRRKKLLNVLIVSCSSISIEFPQEVIQPEHATR